MYDAGRMDKRVTLETLTEGVDGEGMPIESSWGSPVEVWADVRFLSGLETVKSDSALEVTRGSLRIGYRSGINARTTRAIYDGRVLDIKAVLPDDTGRDTLDLVFEIGQNGG